MNQTKNSMEIIGNHIKEASSELEQEMVNEFINKIKEGNKVFVLGAGRSGFVAKMFAMRLMHLGFNSFVVGETITPALSSEDTVVAISGSGETSSTIKLAKTTKENNATLISVTSNRDSTLSSLSDNIISVKSEFSNKKIDKTKIAPLGTLFEITALVLLDSIVSQIMKTKDISEEYLEEMHATLE
ncbi:MAG: D-arabinose 5-phosphate isomerase GutQ [Candidatus Methanohalarchaeum thermophilum]|uniref:D-arabinose 5-phosphate isomerase GutQ n=1 Tax=Methanohalarchaeum thermophilum TaxID=1903181 RepID=A0A1Q6DXE4_METT1|nr:MAG: D-arabinose 5-phosphate isomerase GutQ [Candidatus Methanohalarchaeum thermophilum]